MQEEPKKKVWMVPSQMENDGRVFVIRSGELITMAEAEYSLSRWKEQNLTCVAPERIVHEILYETWRPGPQ